MKRMATLAATQGVELQANIAKYMEESEKEDITEVGFVMSVSLCASTKHQTDRVTRCYIIPVPRKRRKAKRKGPSPPLA